MNNQSLRQLIEQRDELERRIAEMRAEMRDAKLAEARAIIEEFDFNAFELGLVKTQHIKRGRDGKTFKPTAKRAPAPPLYRDPQTGATWSGRGRQPRWMEGHARDEYLIHGAE